MQDELFKNRFVNTLFLVLLRVASICLGLYLAQKYLI